MSEIHAEHAIISGRVQGVWYRAWTRKAALKIGLKGWVRNRTDGTVEAVFCGTGEQITEMLKRCQKGPPLARVQAIHHTETEIPELQDFELRSTA
ncbi:MAG: acylphosphatase [Magnetovibrio sp.]|nr:acylphosphatase [Magnetovibrio sp.]